MPRLYECTTCKMPFLAEDEGLIARRHGRCPQCTKAEFLNSIGLSSDFTFRSFDP